MKEKPAKVFVTCGNTHQATFENVCHAVNLTIGKIKIIHIFDTEASAKKADTTGRTGKIREILGNIEVRTSPVDENSLQQIIPDCMSELLREFGRDKIIVDLSNGQKITSSVLYAVATISRIENIYVLESNVDWRQLPPDTRLPTLERKKDWDYISIEPLHEILNITRSSQVELVYYRDRINEVVESLKSKNEVFANDSNNRLEHSLIDYFASSNVEDGIASKLLEGCVSSLGKICEEVSVYWHNHCARNGAITTPASDFNSRVKQIIKRWNELRNQVTNRELSTSDHFVVRTFMPTLATDVLLDCVRVYRNLASHSGNPYIFTRNDARLVLDTTLLILERVANSDILIDEIFEASPSNE